LTEIRLVLLAANAIFILCNKSLFFLG